MISDHAHQQHADAMVVFCSGFVCKKSFGISGNNTTKFMVRRLICIYVRATFPNEFTGDGFS